MNLLALNCSSSSAVSLLSGENTESEAPGAAAATVGGAATVGAEPNPPPPVCPKTLPLPGSLKPKPPVKPPDVEKLKEEAEPNPEEVEEDEAAAAGGAAKEKEAAEEEDEEPKPEEDAGTDDPNSLLLLLLVGAPKLKVLAWTAAGAPKPADNQRD